MQAGTFIDNWLGLNRYSSRHILWFRIAFASLITVCHILSTFQISQWPTGFEQSWPLLWAFCSTVLALLGLEFFGGFRSLRISPRITEFLLIFPILLASDFMAHQILQVALVPMPQTLWSYVVRAALTTLKWLLFHYIAAWVMSSLGYQTRIALLLNEQERENVRLSFTKMGLIDSVQLFPVDADLNLLDQQTDFLITSASKLQSSDEQYAAICNVLSGYSVLDYNELREDIEGRVNLDQPSSLFSSFHHVPLSLRIYLHIKNIIEPIIACALLFLLSPFLILISLLIKLTSSGPILFRQTRLGTGGVPFELMKFRTMSADAESDGPQWSLDNDPRITVLGRFLRKTHIDELPQLWNIGAGQLSFIGPRPERPEFYEKLKNEIPLFHMRTAIKPGLSGWAQVCGGYVASIEGSRSKLAYDLFYMKRLGFRMDILCTALTVLHIVLKVCTGQRSFDEETVMPKTPAHSRRHAVRYFFAIGFFFLAVTWSLSTFAVAISSSTELPFPVQSEPEATPSPSVEVTPAADSTPTVDVPPANCRVPVCDTQAELKRLRTLTPQGRFEFYNNLLTQTRELTDSASLENLLDFGKQAYALSLVIDPVDKWIAAVPAQIANRALEQLLMQTPIRSDAYKGFFRSFIGENAQGPSYEILAYWRDQLKDRRILDLDQIYALLDFVADAREYCQQSKYENFVVNAASEILAEASLQSVKLDPSFEGVFTIKSTCVQNTATCINIDRISILVGDQERGIMLAFVNNKTETSAFNFTKVELVAGHILKAGSEKSNFKSSFELDYNARTGAIKGQIRTPRGDIQVEGRQTTSLRSVYMRAKPGSPPPASQMNGIHKAKLLGGNDADITLEEFAPNEFKALIRLTSGHLTMDFSSGFYMQSKGILQLMSPPDEKPMKITLASIEVAPGKLKWIGIGHSLLSGKTFEIEMQ